MLSMQRRFVAHICSCACIGCSSTTAGKRPSIWEVDIETEMTDNCETCAPASGTVVKEDAMDPSTFSCPVSLSAGSFLPMPAIIIEVSSSRLLIALHCVL